MWPPSPISQDIKPAQTRVTSSLEWEVGLMRDCSDRTCPQLRSAIERLPVIIGSERIVGSLLFQNALIVFLTMGKAWDGLRAKRQLLCHSARVKRNVARLSELTSGEISVGLAFVLVGNACELECEQA